MMTSKFGTFVVVLVDIMSATDRGYPYVLNRGYQLPPSQQNSQFPGTALMLPWGGSTPAYSASGRFPAHLPVHPVEDAIT